MIRLFIFFSIKASCIDHLYREKSRIDQRKKKYMFDLLDLILLSARYPIEIEWRAITTRKNSISIAQNWIKIIKKKVSAILSTLINRIRQRTKSKKHSSEIQMMTSITSVFSIIHWNRLSRERQKKTYQEAQLM